MVRPPSEAARRARRGLAVAACCIVAVWGGWSCRAGDGASRSPSVILVVADALRADYLGAYGFEGEISPAFDRLAAESVVFDRCWAPAPWTKPSVASMLTSLEPRLHGVVDHRGRFGAGEDGPRVTDALPDEAVTLAEVLQEHGYATAAFVANPWMRAPLGFGQGFDVYRANLAGLRTPGGRVVRAALSWLEARPERGPFLLYLHLMDVHGPYDAGVGGPWGRSPTLGEVRRLTADEMRATPPYLRRSRLGRGGRVQVRAWRAAYAGGVHRFDRHLGGMVERLAESGTLEESVLIVTSDHGEELLEHGGLDHGWSLREHQLHVPLLIRLPGGRGGGRRVGELVSLLDLMPTVLDLAGAPAPRGVQGRSLLSLLEGGGRGGSDEVVLAGAVKGRPAMSALRRGSVKLVVGEDGEAVALFDLEADPGERQDLLAARPGLAAELLGLLEARREEAAAGRLAGQTAEVGDAEAAALEALGYLE